MCFEDETEFRAKDDVWVSKERMIAHTEKDGKYASHVITKGHY